MVLKGNSWLLGGSGVLGLVYFVLLVDVKSWLFFFIECEICMKCYLFVFVVVVVVLVFVFV